MQIDDINWIEQGDPQDQETLNRPTKELQEKLKTGDGVIQNDTTGNAQTQTTFESTRKINDTSFDGSEDITTEKWGEQRNIQVDLSKTSQTEVNGSEDVLNVGVDGILGLAQGGTGQGTQAQARTNLGLGNSQVLNTGTGTSNVLLGQNSQHQFQFSGSCLDFVVGNSTTTGRVRITLPWKTNSGKMVQFKIHIFQGYRQIEEYTVSGYLFQSDNNWHQPQQFHTHAQGTQPDIVFGRDNSGFAYVSVGVGQHQGVKVDSLVIGYTGTLQDHMNKGWSAVFNTSTPNQVQSINAVNIHSQNYTVYTYTKQQVDSKFNNFNPSTSWSSISGKPAIGEVIQSNLVDYGYTKFPDGLMIHWGRGRSIKASSGDFTIFNSTQITFQTAFHTLHTIVANRTIGTGVGGNGQYKNQDLLIGYYTKTSFRAIFRDSSAGLRDLDYIAIGRWK